MSVLFTGTYVVMNEIVTNSIQLNHNYKNIFLTSIIFLLCHWDGGGGFVGSRVAKSSLRSEVPNRWDTSLDLKQV